MRTLILKSDNLNSLEEQLDIYIKQEMFHKFSGFAESTVNLNKLEAFKLIYNKLIKSNPDSFILEHFFEKIFLKACEYKRNKFLIFLFSNKEFFVNSFNQKLGFCLAIKNKNTFKILSKKFKLKEEYYTDLIYSLVLNNQKKNKNNIYSMTNILIKEFGYFPSKKLYNQILNKKSFERLNILRNKDNFRFSEYLYDFDSERYIIYNYKSLLSREIKSIENEYEEIIKKIKISNF